MMVRVVGVLWELAAAEAFLVPAEVDSVMSGEDGVLDGVGSVECVAVKGCGLTAWVGEHGSECFTGVAETSSNCKVTPSALTTSNSPAAEAAGEVSEAGAEGEDPVGFAEVLFSVLRVSVFAGLGDFAA